MKKYRIITSVNCLGNVEYVPQIKGLFFWHNIKTRSDFDCSLYEVSYFNLDDAKSFIKSEIDHHKKILQEKQEQALKKQTNQKHHHKVVAQFNVEKE